MFDKTKKTTNDKNYLNKEIVGSRKIGSIGRVKSSMIAIERLETTVIPYRTKFHRTKFLSDNIFRRTKFLTPSRNFDNFVRFLPDL